MNLRLYHSYGCTRLSDPECRLRLSVGTKPLTSPFSVKGLVSQTKMMLSACPDAVKWPTVLNRLVSFLLPLRAPVTGHGHRPKTDRNS